jgi:probable rRNA maturation factor
MAPQQSTLLFHVATPGLGRRDLRAFAKVLESELAAGRAFGCLVTNDEEMRRLNREFRKQDHSTDVLSFPSGAPQGFLGDLAISFERASEQAGELGHGVAQEIQILMLHGVLHLLGLDHETDRGQMSRAERKWRVTFGLPAGLIERVRA